MSRFTPINPYFGGGGGEWNTQPCQKVLQILFIGPQQRVSMRVQWVVQKLGEAGGRVSYGVMRRDAL